MAAQIFSHHGRVLQFLLITSLMPEQRTTMNNSSSKPRMATMVQHKCSISTCTLTTTQTHSHSQLQSFHLQIKKHFQTIMRVASNAASHKNWVVRAARQPSQTSKVGGLLIKFGNLKILATAGWSRIKGICFFMSQTKQITTPLQTWQSRITLVAATQSHLRTLILTSVHLSCWSQAFSGSNLVNPGPSLLIKHTLNLPSSSFTGGQIHQPQVNNP